MTELIVIYGPTATGKTKLALRLAKKFGGELISADSRQVYRDLDIGTGKVDFKSKVTKYQGFWIVDGVKIRGFDIVKPGKQFTVADFIKSASTSLIRISEVKKLPIMVGGTGFYIKSLIDGIDSIGIPVNLILRRELQKLSIDKLYQKLLGVDPTRAKSMNQSDRANPRRLVRAIEIASYEKKSSFAHEASEDKQETTYYQLLFEPERPQSRRPTTNYILLGLTAPNDYLYKRADNWLEARLKNGLIEEVDNLLKQNIDPNWLDNLGLEYRWITKYLLKKISLEESIRRLTGDIHNFIRRQKTWFKKFKNIEFYDISDKSWLEELEKRVTLWYISHSLQAFA